MPFGPDFLWGAATASYQIEGAARLYGRGECIWTRFSHTPGNVKNGDTGDTACDHYHRYRDDIALMRDIGLTAYRFSISWPRILPAGTGEINRAGIDFYDRLVDALLEANITPFATLYHWDLPQALQDRGGWVNPQSVEWFADYAEIVTRALGDRVKHWITHNEPWVIAFLGYYLGIHAPGIRSLPDALKAGHHLLLSHGAAMPRIHANAPGAQAGITLNLFPIHPATESAEDRLAAQYQDGWANRWFLEPVFHGRYPADMIALFGGALEGIDLSAVQTARVPGDFLGVNYYTRRIAAYDAADPFYSRDVRPQNAAFTAMDWEVYPQGLTELLLKLYREYTPPRLYVTENGAAYVDPPPVNGVVEDPERRDYLAAHLDAIEAAIAQGAPVKGYFAWSLLDNFEWAEGYTKRFGIIHVDYATQKRTLKRSALYYRDRIAQERALIPK